MNELRKSIRICIDLLKGFNINYNSMVGPRTYALINQIKILLPNVRTKYPQIADILNFAINTINNNGFINAYAFGDIRTSIKILDSLEFLKPSESIKGKKIFISHSSMDKAIVTQFVDHILQLGSNIQTKDICCTSIEEMGIKNGEDIRRHIYTNIKSTDFSFLLISQNYKESEICINEMGAVWAYDANVRLYLLPNITFKSIGWLCDVRQAEFINSAIALDILHKELIEYYSLQDDIATWSRQRETFINFVNNL